MALLSKHFLSYEFQCPCCNQLTIDMQLIRGLEALRVLANNRPVIISSGFRCEEHNKAVGGSLNSQHLLGKAADIKILGYSPKEIKEFAGQIPVFQNGGIGLYSTFVHLDVRGWKARWEGR